MGSVTANPLIHEFDLMSAINISALEMDDQYIQLPSFKNFIRWILGKPLHIKVKDGLSFDKVQSYLTILDGKRSIEKEEIDKMKREFK